MFTGFLEPGETPEQEIVREIEEELGLEATNTTFLGHFPLPRLNQIVIAYWLEGHGKLTLNSEIAEIRSVTAEELAVFDFGPLTLTTDVVAQWRRIAGGAGNAKEIRWP